METRTFDNLAALDCWVVTPRWCGKEPLAAATRHENPAKSGVQNESLRPVFRQDGHLNNAHMKQQCREDLECGYGKWCEGLRTVLQEDVRFDK